mgnify:CR=1 FL=1
MATAIIFKNDSPEEFTWSWDSTPYTFKAGQEYMMEDWKAQHFALHLADRELLRRDAVRTKDNQNPDTNLGNEKLRAELMRRYLPDGEILTAPDASKLTTEILQSQVKTPSPWCDSCDSRGVVHKKDCPKRKKLPEAEFEGLKT